MFANCFRALGPRGLNTRAAQSQTINTDTCSSQNEIEKLRSQLDDMRARCEKAEKEKSEILMRRLATMETMSNKTMSTGEVAKLQKKNEGIARLEISPFLRTQRPRVCSSTCAGEERAADEDKGSGEGSEC